MFENLVSRKFSKITDLLIDICDLKTIIYDYMYYYIYRLGWLIDQFHSFSHHIIVYPRLYVDFIC